MTRKKLAPPKVRRLWRIKPVERVEPSAKVYSRKKLQPTAVENGSV